MRAEARFVGRWWVLGATTFLELVAGLGFTFSLYSSHLKDVLHLTQPQLQGLGTVMLCGGLFGIFPGILYDKMYHKPRIGPRLTALVGVVCHFIGYLVIWATISKQITPPFFLLIVNGFVLCNGPSWNDTVSNVVNIQNFPLQRGSVAGILKGFHGISASIMASIFASCFASDISAFLLFLAVVPTLVAVLAVIFLNRLPEQNLVQDGRAGRRMLWLTVGLVGLYLYQSLTALVRALTDIDQRAVIWLTIGCLVFMVALIACVPFGSGEPFWKSLRSEKLQDPLLENLTEGTSQEVQDQPPLGYMDVNETSTLQAVLSVDFWLLFSAIFLGMGFGITVSNNLGQQVIALGGGSQAKSIAVLVYSTFHGLGCLSCGPLSEYVVQNLDTGRTVVLVWASIGVAISSLLLALSNISLLLPCTALAGLISGSYWPLFPSCTADLFGSRHFAATRGIMHWSSSLGSALFSIVIAGRIYEAKAKHHKDHDGVCIGQDCFGLTFLIIAGVAVGQTILSAWLHHRSKPLYGSLKSCRELQQNILARADNSLQHAR